MAENVDLAFDLGKLKKVSKLDPRVAWPDEVRDFTPWLAKHLDQLADEVGLKKLDFVDTEVVIEDLCRIDILAKDQRARTVVIENQLGESDHSHLGQVLSYISCVGADVAIWITTEAKLAHKSAIRWLNRNTLGRTEFYLVLLELIKIGDSNDLAPKFTLLEKPLGTHGIPSAILQQDLQKDLGGTQRLYLKFWTFFRDSAAGSGNEFEKCFAGKDIPYQNELPLVSEDGKKISFNINTLGIKALGIWVGARYPDSSWEKLLREGLSAAGSALGAQAMPSKGEKYRGFWVFQPNSPIENESDWSKYILWFTSMVPKVRRLVREYPAFVASLEQQSSKSDPLTQVDLAESSVHGS